MLHFASLELGDHLAAGKYSDVYALASSTGKQVIKIMDVTHSTLQREHHFYTKLRDSNYFPEVSPLVRTANKEGLIMSYTGCSLPNFIEGGVSAEDLGPVVAYLAYHMLATIRFIHRRGIVHGDIQPDNFTCRVDVSGRVKVYLVDFGAATVNGETQRPDMVQINPFFASSRRMKSLNKEPTKVDDLVSLAYTLIFLLKKVLPWKDEYEMFTSSQSRLDFERLATVKENIEPESLYAGVPAVYKEFLESVLKLQPNDTPDYLHYQKTFREYSEEALRRLLL